MTNVLAINGGKKIRNKLFPENSSIDDCEKHAVSKVLETGVLSRFLGSWHKNFYGGHEVQSLEKEWTEFFNVKHAIAVNSATSALNCAVGALGVGPGDEVIVSPYTMTASAVAPLVYNAIPIFADIESEYFCLDLQDIESKITPRTKAIIVVDIFGQPYDRDGINELAAKYKLKVIEDAAQAPGVKYKGQYAGTLGDIGIFSLNYHKHIHCGEGGIIVTNDDEVAEKLKLIRNHAEAVVEAKGCEDLTNMLGFNYRMTEIEASIAREQLKKLPKVLQQRINNVNYFHSLIQDIDFIKIPPVRESSEHAYYMDILLYESNKVNVHRNKFIEAVQAELMPSKLQEEEGIGIDYGYVKPLYLQPLFQNKVAYGRQGCPWTCDKYNESVDYSKGICPVTEELHYESLITSDLIYPNMTKTDIEDVANAFIKVANNLNELPALATKV